MGYEWTEDEQDDFTVKAIVGKVTADGKMVYANQGKAKKGTVLYRVIWADSEGSSYPPDMVWYEPSENISAENDALLEFEQQAVREAEEEAQAAREEEELGAMEEEDALPPL